MGHRLSPPTGPWALRCGPRRILFLAPPAVLGWIAAFVLLSAAPVPADAQVENVPISNQVYEFLDRLGVRGVLPLQSSTMIPMSRAAVADLLREAASKRSDLSGAEAGYLEKFTREFAHELDPAGEDAAGLFNGSPAADFISQKEKYLYHYNDSAASLYLSFIGSLEHRRADGDSYNATHASFETHGFRARGTIKGRLGYFAQVTNGTLFGDRAFALSDPRLRTNVKFNDLNSPYFDFAEAYLRADLSWFNAEFGREFLRLGTGYSDRLILSDNAPALDMIKIDARYGSVRYTFLHGSILMEPAWFDGLPADDPLREVNKYVAIHRLEFSALGAFNAGFSEAVVYRRTAPEFAYLNPLIFLKSAEHSLRDRDNTMIALDLEAYPRAGYKLFGALLVDDVDFSKLGTGWWGNEFAWQGGTYLSDVAGIRDVDFHVEYTRIEPYVYSNRIVGNAYTSGEFGLGHRLEPNSDEWLVRIISRPSPALRGSVGFRRVRHGANIVENGVVVFNAGGDALVGHRDTDSDTAEFLAGILTETRSVEVGAFYEPVTDLVFQGSYEYRHQTGPGGGTTDHFVGLRGTLEF
jgi:hypothetical protein